MNLTSKRCLAVVATGLMAIDLMAAPLPPVNVAGQLVYQGVGDTTRNMNTLGTVTHTVLAASGTTYTATMSASLPSGNPTIEVTGNGLFFGQVQLYYSFRVNGPDFAAIPITVSGEVSAFSSSPLSIADAQINPGPYQTSGPMLRACSRPTPGPGCAAGPQAQVGSFQYAVAANTVQFITMTVGFYTGSPLVSTMRAFADPVVNITPGFASAGS